MDVFLFSSSSSSFLYDCMNYGRNQSKFAELGKKTKDVVKETCSSPAATFAATPSEAASVVWL